MVGNAIELNSMRIIDNVDQDKINGELIVMLLSIFHFAEDH